MLSFLNDIDNFFCRLEGKKKHTTLNGAIQKPTDARSNTIQQPKVNKQILKENAKKIGLGSILYNLFVSKEYKDQGLDGWREDKEKFKVDLINDIKTFLFTKWEKPWKAGLVFDDNGKILSGFRNMSGRVYKNESNVMSLSSKSGNSPFFVTLNKLNKLGGKIIDKLKTVWVISYIPIYKDVKLNGKDDNQDRSPDFMLPKFHQVINVDFVEGIEKPKYKTVEFKKLELNEYVENFVNELKRLRRLPKLYYDQSDRCFYKRSLLTWDNESIHLVPINSFKNIESYYSTLFHEITHSTMNPKRCGRGKFKDASLAYANEELVAEMGAMIICEELGLKYQRQNSLSYLNGWLKQAKGSDIDSALIEAYAYACDAADYLLDGINLDKLVPKTLAKRAEEQDKKSETGADLSKNTKSKSESKLQPKAWEQTKEEYVKQYRIKINEEYRSTGWKRQSEASKKRVNKLQQDKAQALRVHKEVVAKEFAKGTEIPTNVLRDYPELKLSEIDKTIEQLIANAEPFRTVKLTDVSYGKDFKDGYVNTPIGRVRIDKVQIRKLIRKARVEFFGLIKPTLEKPLIIVTSKDNNGNEREAFIKTFTDGKTIFFVSFVKTDENLVLVSNHPRREGQIKKILSEGNITYPQDSITALSGLPNITEPRYKTLLIGLRLKSLSKDKQKPNQSQTKKSNNQKPKEVKTTHVLPRTKPDELNYDLAYNAHRGTSFDPEIRAKEHQKNYSSSLNSYAEQFEAIIKNEEQKEIAIDEFERFKKGYTDKYNAWLRAKANCISPMITGPSKFPTKRAEKANNTEHKRLTEFINWEEKAVKAIEAKIKGKTSKDVADAERWKRHEKEVISQIATIVGIHQGKIPLSKPLIVGALKRFLMAMYKGRYFADFSKSLELIKEAQKKYKITIFAPHNPIWELQPQAEAEPENKEPETIYKADGCEVVNNYQAQRVQMTFNGKPAPEVITALKKSAFKWSPSQKVWQRKNTRAGIYAALEIAKKYFPSNEPTPEPEKPTTKSKSTKLEVVDFPIKDIYTDEKRFQNRVNAFSEDSKNRIINAVKNGTFDWAKFDPITIWKDPKDDKHYVISGHSRKAAFWELAQTKEVDSYSFMHIPARIFKGTESQAIDFALNSNTLSTKETEVERALYYNKQRAVCEMKKGLNGKSDCEKQVESACREAEGKNANYILNLSYLNPNGYLIDSLARLGVEKDNDSTNLLRTIANWIGEARRSNPEISDTQETEIAQYLINGGYGNKSGQFRNKTQFNERLDYSFNKWKANGANPSKPLNLANTLSKTSFEKEWDERLAKAKEELDNAIAEHEEKHKKYLFAVMDGSLTQARMDELMKPIIAYVEKAKKEYERVKGQKDDVKKAASAQTSLWGVNGVKARKNEFWTEIHGEIKLVEMLENGMITWDDFTKGKCTGIRAKSELFKTKKEAINYFKPKPLNGIDEVNTQFNHELNLLIKGKLPNNHIFRLGMPSNALLNAGLDNLSIEMPASTLLVKSSSEYKSNHPFSLTDIANLPSAIAAPIAVFEAELDPIRKVVLTELKDERKVNFICILDLFEKRAYGKQAIIVNSIISLYPKSSAAHIAKWFLGRECEEIGRDLLLWVDKEKALKWSSGHSSYVNAAKLSSKRIANIIQNFKNPTSTPNNLNGETKNLLGLQPISSTRKGKTYRIKGDLGQFLGEYDRNNYTIVLRGDKGAGKSRLLYQLINAFASKQLRVAFLSLEMAKNSSITQRYKNEYISKANLKRIDITDQAPTYDDLNTICKDYDVVGIDSWTKLKGITQLDFDRLQKDNPNTIIICIFQSTTGKVTRGGNMPEYDAGTVIQVNKGGLAECEKNRYAPTDMIYNVFTKSLEPQEEEQKPND